MVDAIRIKIRSFLNYIEPVKGIAFFLFLFLFFELVWKICVHIGHDGEQLLVFGNNLTYLVQPICEFDAKVIHWIIHDLFGHQNYLIDGTLVYFEGALKMNIIWTCTSIKQLLMFSFIMIFYWGPWRKKVIFLPLSLLFLSLMNFVRLVISAFLLKNGLPEWFIPINEILNGATWDNTNATYWKFYEDWYHFFHDGFFKWIYYDGIMFLIWLLWQERFNLPYQRLRKQ